MLPYNNTVEIFISWVSLEVIKMRHQFGKTLEDKADQLAAEADIRKTFSLLVKKVYI